MDSLAVDEGMNRYVLYQQVADGKSSRSLVVTTDHHQRQDPPPKGNILKAENDSGNNKLHVLPRPSYLSRLADEPAK